MEDIMEENILTYIYHLKRKGGNMKEPKVIFRSLLKKGLSDSVTLNKGTLSWDGLVSFQLPQGQYHLSAS